jgi:hypothetical protein
MTAPAMQAHQLSEDERNHLMHDAKGKNTALGVTVACGGAALVLLGSALTRKAAYGQLTTVSVVGYVVFLACLFAAVTYSFLWYRRELDTWRKSDPIYQAEQAEQSGLPGGMGDQAPSQAMGNPEVQRLCTIVAQLGMDFYPKWGEWEFDEDNKNAIVTYAFAAQVPGTLSTSAAQNKVFERLNSGLGKGWAIDLDPETDEIYGSKKSDVPKLALPDIWTVVKSPQEAAAQFDKLEISLGIGANGPITYKPKQFPHVLMVGSTGGGKSVAVRSIIEEYLAAGYRIFAVDGKGTDYAPYFTHPNFSAISTNLQEHIMVIHKVWAILQSRRSKSARASKAGDTSWRQTMTPILLVLDEFASMRNNMKATYKADELKLIDRDLADILKVGREFRVNVILATQDLKADTLPTDWLDMFPMKASAGKPAPMTIKKAFPEEIHGEVTRVGQSISRTTPGRSLVAVTDADGKNHVELFQAYWSYTPAETIDAAPDVVRGQWMEFKKKVTDQVPRMYAREWFRMEYPPMDPKDKKDRFAQFREDEPSYIDLTEFDVTNLHRLRPVPLEDPKTLAPIVDNACFDPLSEHYLGNPPLDADGSDDIIDF